MFHALDCAASGVNDDDALLSACEFLSCVQLMQDTLKERSQIGR